jgi:hypothetical protein
VAAERALEHAKKLADMAAASEKQAKEALEQLTALQEN